MKNETLALFLSKKPLYYKEIDHKRVHKAYEVLHPHIKRPKTVHIVGTNGKGSTGRILAHLAYKSGHLVGHFSSPHILKFNERIWINGADSSDNILEIAHQKLYIILGESMSEVLSYFEYTTLLAFVVFEKCDLVVLEAGLGGEFDATNVCDKELSIITPIGIDHQAFLGDSIKEIASTKIRSIQNKALLSPQVYDEVVDVAKKIANDIGAKLYICPQNREIDSNKLIQIAKDKGWGEYLIDNAIVAMKALDILGINYNVDELKGVKLFGRFYALTEHIRIDVGHNPLAAKAIKKALDKTIDKKVVLIYNSLDDKDYEEVLRILKPNVKRVEIISISSQRASTTKEIEEAIKKVELPYSQYKNKIDKDEYYLVFGSFYVVEAFLRSTEEGN